MNASRRSPLPGTGPSGDPKVTSEIEAQLDLEKRTNDCLGGYHVVCRFIEEGQYNKAAAKLISLLNMNPNNAEIFARMDTKSGSQIGILLDKSSELRAFFAKNPETAMALKHGNPNLAKQINHAVQEGRERLFAGVGKPGNPIEKEVQTKAEELKKKILGKMHLLGANHEAKTEILKAVGRAANNPIQFGALMQLAKDPKIGPLITSAFGSAIGGAAWTKGAYGSHHNHDAVELSANAMKVFLRLTETGTLDQTGTQQVVAKLGPKETDALRNPQSPFWQGLQGLPIEQRSQMASAIEALPDYQAKKTQYASLKSTLDGSVRNNNPLEKLNNALTTFSDRLDLRNTGFNVPSDAATLNLSTSDFAKLSRDWGGEGSARGIVDRARQTVESASRNPKTREELGQCQKLLAEARNLERELSSLRTSIMVGQFGADPERVLNEKIAANPRLKEAGITTYGGWKDICQEKIDRKTELTDHITAALHESGPDRRLAALNQCTRELSDFCQWGIAMANAEKEIVSIREEVGMKSVTREELFAPSGNDALQFGQQHMLSLMRQVVSSLALGMSPESQDRFREAILSSMDPAARDGATKTAGGKPLSLESLSWYGGASKDIISLLVAIEKNPGHYGFEADFKLPDSARQMIEIARRVEQFG
jgi:hypothetical protein